MAQVIPLNPRELSLPHDAWRQYQRETAEWCLDLQGVGILDASTGSGKTSYAGACAYAHKTIALCRTKNLQQENYGDTYGFQVLFGRGSYPCVHPDAQPGATCADCLHIERGESTGGGMSGCPHSGECVYLNQKHKVLNSNRASLNYAYWLSSVGVRQRDTEYLFLDECHQLSDLVLEWAGCSITNAERLKWGLPLFPLASSKTVSSSKSLVQIEDSSTDRILDWLSESIGILEGTLPELELTDKWGQPLPMNEEQRKLLNEGEQLLRKLRSTLEGLVVVEEDWFVQSGPLALTWGEERRPGMLVKPLTARYHYPRFFPSGSESEMDERHPRCVLMSATIGDFDTFAQELGIQAFEGRRVPSQWPAERRPIYILDVPKLNYKSALEDYDRQAQAIAQAILTVPKDWCGIIHVTRKKEATLLANRLARYGLQDRVWVPENGSTIWMAQQWERRKLRVAGSLMVSHAFHEGFDGLEERICVTAKVPFAFLGDPYEVARQRRSGSFYLQRAAWSLMQQLGRTRRGREVDYDVPGERRGLCLIADANWRKLSGLGKGKQYLSEDFVESVIEWK